MVDLLKKIKRKIENIAYDIVPVEDKYLEVLGILLDYSKGTHEINLDKGKKVHAFHMNSADFRKAQSLYASYTASESVNMKFTIIKEASQTLSDDQELYPRNISGNYISGYTKFLYLVYLTDLGKYGIAEGSL